ncbi:MAG TPA: amidohydrolase family protein [bacterium]|nr:amidohydrolase family protein [bacterium]
MTEAQRIDISAHILPKRFFDEVVATAPPGFYMQKLFGSDMPFDIEGGSRYIRLTLAAIEEMSAPAAVKQRMLRDNARRLLKL